MLKRSGLAGLLVAVLSVPVAQADVTVRVEGADSTLLATTVPRTGPDVTKDGNSCGGSTAAGALDRAVGGDWDGTYYDGFGLTVDRIFTETLSFSSNRYWGFDRNNTFSNEGICGYSPADGDELLFYAACAGPTTGCFNGKPLDVTAPAKVTTGVPFTVTVRQFDDLQDPAVATPAEGATVGGATTGADGTAQLTLSTPGTVTLTATKGDQVRDETTVTVADPPAPGASPEPSASPSASPAPVADTRPPYSGIKGIREQQVFRKRKAPRTLTAAVDEPVAKVTLGLTRQAGRRCSAFSGTKAAFVRVRCGRHPRFSVGSDTQVSYLLPKRLAKGRYVLDVVATDRAGNEEQLARGRNRVVFFVR